MESEYQFERRDEAPIQMSKIDMKTINSIGRLALSKSICRFELPMDMRQFKSNIISANSFKFLNLGEINRELSL